MSNPSGTDADTHDAVGVPSTHPTWTRSPRSPQLYAMASTARPRLPATVPRDPLPVSNAGAPVGPGGPDFALYSQHNDTPSVGVSQLGEDRHVVHVGTWASMKTDPFRVSPNPAGHMPAGQVEDDLNWAQPRWAVDDMEPAQLKEEGKWASAATFGAQGIAPWTRRASGRAF